MKEDSFVHKKIILTLALLVATFALTISPAAVAHDHGSHASNGRARHRAKSKPRARRAAKRSRKNKQQQSQPQQAMYICPMHHEVRSKTAGDCPKCRMELELEETTAKAKSE